MRPAEGIAGIVGLVNPIHSTHNLQHMAAAGANSMLPPGHVVPKYMKQSIIYKNNNAQKLDKAIHLREK